MALLRDSFSRFADIPPGMAGMKDWGSFAPDLKNKKMVTETHLIRHFLGIRQVLDQRELEDTKRLPALGGPADEGRKSRVARFLFFVSWSHEPSARVFCDLRQGFPLMKR